MERASAFFNKRVYSAGRAMWSRENSPSTHSEDAMSSTHVDRLEKYLLTRDTVSDEQLLIEEFQRIKKQATEACVSSQREGSPLALVPEPGPSQQTERRTATRLQSVDPSQGTEGDEEQSPAPSHVDSPDSQDNVIIFGTGTLSVWDSDTDSQILASTDCQMIQPKVNVLEQIMVEGLEFPVEGWHTRVRTTVHVLADNFLQHWLAREAKCRLHRGNFATINRWTDAVKTHEIQLELPTVVIALQCLRQIECLEPLRNRIIGLCRAVRNANPGTRIFVATNIGNPRAAPVLGKRAYEHNQLLDQAVRGVNKAVGSVFVCDVAVHFCSNGQYIQPTRAYFTPEGDLTALGCFTYRACMFKEIGIVPYHW